MSAIRFRETNPAGIVVVIFNNKQAFAHASYEEVQDWAQRQFRLSDADLDAIHEDYVADCKERGLAP